MYMDRYEVDNSWGLAFKYLPDQERFNFFGWV